jgi:peroxiredoxin
MRILSVWLTFAAAMSSSVFAQHPADERGFIVRVGDVVPEFSLTDLNGTEYTRESLYGQTYVLQFTASWCGVCRKEMPHLEKDVWQAFRERPFVLIGVDLDEPIDKISEFAQATGITYPIAPDPAGNLFYRIAGQKTGVTRNVVVNDRGEIVFLTRLFEEGEFREMISLIDDLTR